MTKALFFTLIFLVSLTSTVFLHEEDILSEDIDVGQEDASRHEEDIPKRIKHLYKMLLKTQYKKDIKLIPLIR